ncbi:hypothetical protein F511_04984 [Dorcoceras hygrometricum]|uniref:Uncharacterized protein n=1 Tax=Dorcoceras hygrometricum TaxID=472368 RepID=A0A2Z7DG24_9LAMI|nr:hypothetical protein F511_04984 [Dorcoceras hygrometricum]
MLSVVTVHQILFTKSYLLRLSTVDSSDGSKSGSVGLLLLRRFFLYRFWRLCVSSKRIANIGYPRMSASGESSTTMHRLLHASGSHLIPPPDDLKTNQYNQDLGLIHSTNGNHLECPNEGSSIDHQVTIYLHAQNISMFSTNERWYFASHILVSSLGGLILISTAQSTRNMFSIQSDY